MPSTVSSKCRKRTPLRPRCGSLRLRAASESEHQAHKIDAHEQGSHGLDEARIDVDDEVTMRSSDRASASHRSNSDRVGSTTL